MAGSMNAWMYTQPIQGVQVVRVFFYGLFMDESLLATKGIEPSEVNLNFVDGYGLHIGERATLIRRQDG